MTVNCIVHEVLHTVTQSMHVNNCHECSSYFTWSLRFTSEYLQYLKSTLIAWCTCTICKYLASYWMSWLWNHTFNNFSATHVLQYIHVVLQVQWEVLVLILKYFPSIILVLILNLDVLVLKYRIAGNFGEGLNLAIWRIFGQNANINLLSSLIISFCGSRAKIAKLNSPNAFFRRFAKY